MKDFEKGCPQKIISLQKLQCCLFRTLTVSMIFTVICNNLLGYGLALRLLGSDFEGLILSLNCLNRSFFLKPSGSDPKQLSCI